MKLTGIARVDHRTKDLVPRLTPGEIAVIDHPDLDEVAAQGLIGARVRAIVNAGASTTGRYPNPGPQLLLEAGIPVLDRVGQDLLTTLNDGDQIEIQQDQVLRAGVVIARGTLLDQTELDVLQEQARANLNLEVNRFIDNTLEYARREKAFVLASLQAPPLDVPMQDRHVLVVVRGHGYRDDLRAIRAYISEEDPVLVGVDGGADALLEMGYRPQIIVGDMDSVSDKALQAAREIVVHAYPNGRAPGLARVQQLGLDAKMIAAPGTSEDIGMLLAYEAGAALIVAVGTHSHLIDFLEKGRAGMASTFLTRLKVGPVLVDAKGVSRLYHSQPRGRYSIQVALAAAIPIGLILALSQPLKELVKLAWLQMRIWTGW